MVDRLVVWLPCVVILCKNLPLLQASDKSQDLLRLTEVGELDEDKVHDLLHGVDHEKPSQDQDLGHRKPGVWETARLYRRRGDLNMIFV